MSSLLVLFISIAIAVPLSIYLLPKNIFDLRESIFLFSYSFSLCFFPYFLGQILNKISPRTSTFIYLCSNVLRILGIFLLTLIFQWYDPKKSLYALELYVISVAIFLIFQLVAIKLFSNQVK